MVTPYINEHANEPLRCAQEFCDPSRAKCIMQRRELWRQLSDTYKCYKAAR